jgi:hypothetical protein
MKNGFMKMSAMAAVLAICAGLSAQPVRNGKLISVTSTPLGTYFKPLDEIKLSVTNANGNTIAVWDGKGDEYFRIPAAETMTITIGGAIGSQTICLFDKKGALVDKASFDVNCKTEIKDETGYYTKVMNMYYNTMIKSMGGGEATAARIDGVFYTWFVCWLRDHVHTMKGMKYFYPGDLKNTIDLYAKYQREDGMIFDNVYPRGKESNFWDVSFSYGGFIKPLDNGNYEMKRIPVEADVEYLFLEGIYYTWKATGDDKWMESHLDQALKALKYCTSDPYRWSTKYQLIKRGYTIDTWDFQNAEDAAISAGPGNTPHPMVIKPEYTRFNIMHGDNTGIIAGCAYLAEMLDYAGRKEEASKVSAQRKQILENLYKVSWNGQFFTHQIPEDLSIKRDLGADPSKQVSLSNSYDLNRGIDHEKCVEIIKTYQRIRQEMPKSSPGEFYGIYPPFEKGFGGHADLWEYVNGGVSSMVAGELAHGAFENGFEKYGVDIIQRMYALSTRTEEYLNNTYRGEMPEMPKRNFTILDLRSFANVDFDGTKGAKAVPAWTGEGVNDFHKCPVGKQTYHDIPFEIIDPSQNGRKGCIGLSGENGYKLNIVIPINKKTASIYFLYTLCIKSGQKSTNAGTIVINYSDNTSSLDVVDYRKIGNWWYPSDKDMAKRAFKIDNEKSTMVGAYMYGLDNPFPDKTIKSIELQGINIDSKWMILGMTLSDYPVYYQPSFISFGIPDCWCVAALVYATVEGLAGVKDAGVSYNKVRFSPRWCASDVKNVKATIKYEQSGGYVSYKYNLSTSKIDITYTGNASQTEARILLPDGKKAASVTVNGVSTPFKTESVEQSNYAVFSVAGKGVSKISCNLQ